MEQCRSNHIYGQSRGNSNVNADSEPELSFWEPVPLSKRQQHQRATGI